MEDRIRVLFVCVHNSGRSQIAEAYLRKMGGDKFEVESAGLEPAEEVNPLVVEVMKEESIDISQNKPKSVFEAFKQGKLYDHVITVCAASEGKCPVFPGITKRWNWPFPNPAKVEGSSEEKLNKVREIRDMIKERLLNPPRGDFSFKDLASK
jgi:arsenate reductase